MPGQNEYHKEGDQLIILDVQGPMFLAYLMKDNISIGDQFAIENSEYDSMITLGYESIKE